MSSFRFAGPFMAGFCLSVVLGLCPGHLSAAERGLIETDDGRVIYNPFFQAFLAPHVMRCFENSIGFYRNVYRYRPTEKVTILLDDSADYNNAAAWSSPRNSLWVQISPTNTVYETTPSNETINHTMNHEVGHIVALDQATGKDCFFRSIFFGKPRTDADHPETMLYDYLCRPRRSAPRWYHEGIAVFLETWMAGGVGRAQGSYDEMVFRSMVRDSSYFYDPLGLESEGTKIDFQAGVNSYLYGGRFMTYLGYQYSPEQVVEWTARWPKSKSYYSSQFKQVFHRSLGDTWKDWIRFEHDFQRANLDSIRMYPLTPYRDLFPKALGSISRAYFDPSRQTIYAAVNYPGVVGHIAALSLKDGSLRRLCDVKGPAIYFVSSLAYDPASGTLFYSADNDEWRDLYEVNVETGKSHRLMKDVRIGDLVYSAADSALWGIRHFDGISTLVRIPRPYTKFHQVYSWPYGQVMYDIDVSPDAKQISFSLGEINARQTLRLADLDSVRSGIMSPRTLYDFQTSLPANFIFSPDGHYLYGSSYYTGASNIWRYDLARDSMDVVSNCETGFFRPLPTRGDSVIVFRYTGAGFVPSLIEAKPLTDVSPVRYLGNEVVEKHPVVRDWNVGSPLEMNLDSLGTRTGTYQGFGHMGLIAAYPIVEGYKDYGSVGAHLDLQDPGYSGKVGLTFSYTPTSDLDSKERPHVSADLEKGPWRLAFKANSADFYDLFGPTKTSRKGESLGLRYEKNLMTDTPKSLDLSIATAGYIDLERLPYAQNITVSFDKLWTTSANLSFRNLKASLGAVDYEKGYKWRLFAANNYANEKAFPLFAGSFDIGTPLLLDHSSLWLRTAAGYSPGKRIEPFANFYFGGFGNNWVDHGEVKRYRDYDSFPGIEINEAGGTNFVKAGLDWNLPPLRFRRVGFPWFYIGYARTSIFSSGLVTNVDNPSEVPRMSLVDLGAQVDFRFTLLSYMSMTLSLGYAGATGQDRKPSDEFMFSLKIL